MLSVTAYFAQELSLGPYAGLVFAFLQGQSTTLSGAQNGGVFLGMLAVGVAATGLRLGGPRGWVVAGCLGSAASLGVITILGAWGAAFVLMPALADVMRAVLGAGRGIGAVFPADAAPFVIAAAMAARVIENGRAEPAPAAMMPGE